MMTPMGISKLTICGGHGVETIFVDQDMNRVNPDAPPAPGAEHCGLCTLVFSLCWAIALIFSLVAPAGFPGLRRDGDGLAQRNRFTLAYSRAPPHFA